MEVILKGSGLKEFRMEKENMFKRMVLFKKESGRMDN